MYISEIIIYPVKSLGGISLQNSEVKVSGLNYDRNWMLVDQQNQFMTQRTHSQMALIQTAIKNGQLILSCFGLEDYQVEPVNNDMPQATTHVWQDQINVRVHHQNTNNWFSEALGTPCKLVSFANDELRPCNSDYANPEDHTKFADAFPLLVISQASLDALNQRLAEPVTMDRFRPNFVVEDCAPHDEDDWQSIQANNITMHMRKLCSRCQVPTIDQQTGIVSGPEPIQTLASYRQHNGKIVFGVNMTIANEGVISVGDSVTLI